MLQNLNKENSKAINKTRYENIDKILTPIINFSYFTQRLIASIHKLYTLNTSPQFRC